MLKIVESTLKRVIQTLLWSGIHYNLGCDSTPNEVIYNMNPKRVDCHSTALREKLLDVDFNVICGDFFLLFPTPEATWCNVREFHRECYF